jgi:hypothetical protein
LVSISIKKRIGKYGSHQNNTVSNSHIVSTTASEYTKNLSNFLVGNFVSSKLRRSRCSFIYCYPVDEIAIERHKEENQEKSTALKRSSLLLRRNMFNIIIHLFTISEIRLLIPRTRIRVRQVLQEEIRRELF